MHICVIGQNGDIFYTKEKKNPWEKFFSFLEIKGHTFSMDFECSEIDAVICMGFYPKKVSTLLPRIPKSNFILINWEPEVVEPETYKPAYFTNFGKRFSPSIEWARKLEAEKFNWPQQKMNELESFDTWKLRDECAVILQANKFSAHRKAQYKTRRKLIWKIGRKGKLILYGQDWEKSSYQNLRMWLSSLRRLNYRDVSLHIGSVSQPPRRVFRGPADDKMEVMGMYQISLVIENSPDYVSEKLVESVSANCLSIYIGTNLKHYGIEIPDLLLPKPNYRDIKKSLWSLFELSVEERYLLLKKQRDGMSEYCNNSVNAKVLSNLAEACSSYLETTRS